MPCASSSRGKSDGAGIDDGVLLLVAKEVRQLRIEVGYGFEGALNDASAKRIVSETISPRLKRGDFYGGLDAGVDAIISVIGGESLPPAKPVIKAADRGVRLEKLIFLGLARLFLWSAEFCAQYSATFWLRVSSAASPASSPR
jgi:uncharacterized membrane protein YgcG